MSPAETAMTIARAAAEILALVVPAPVGAALLTEAQLKRSNAIANVAEDIKFGPESGE